MGWKTFREHFKIEHMVCILNDEVYVMDGENNCSISINYDGKITSFNIASHHEHTEDGVIESDSIYFLGLLNTLLSTNPDLIKELLDTEDSFTNTKTHFVSHYDGTVVEEVFDASTKHFVTIDGKPWSKRDILSDKQAERITQDIDKIYEGKLALLENSIAEMNQKREEFAELLKVTQGRIKGEK